jgi:hypothetical protein
VGHFKQRAGEVLLQQNITTVWSNNQWRTDDLQAGMEYAIANGWVEALENHRFKLTEAGFDAA